MYLLDPKTMRVRLRKDAEQFSLFGGDPTPVGLTPKGQRAKKQRERWGTQTELFPSNQFSVPTLKPKAPKAAKQPLKPKAPKATLKPKAKEGDTRTNRAGNQEVLRAGHWRRVSKDAPATPGLAVLRDEPAAAPVAAPAVEPEPTLVSAPEPAGAPEPATAGADDAYILHRKSLRPSKQEYSYGRRAQSVTHLPHRTQVAVGSIDELKAFAAQYPDEEWVIEGTAKAEKPGDVWTGKGKDALAAEPTTAPKTADDLTPDDIKLSDIQDTGDESIHGEKRYTLRNLLEPDAGALDLGFFASPDEALVSVKDEMNFPYHVADMERAVGRPGQNQRQAKVAEMVLAEIQKQVAEGETVLLSQGQYGMSSRGARGTYASAENVESLRAKNGAIELKHNGKWVEHASFLNLLALADRLGMDAKKLDAFIQDGTPLPKTPEPTPAPAPNAPAEPDTSHLSALEDSLFREQQRLREAKTDQERQQRQVWIDQKHKEIRGERKFLGLPEDEPIEDLSDDDLLAELTGEPAPTAPDESPTPSLETDADFASTKRQEERIAINQQVRDLLAQKPDGPYTQDEMTLLAKYSGKGGITQDEGSLSEYYTRPDVAKFTTDLLYQNGYKGGVVLEPSCGNGVFLHQLKGDDNTLAVGVELDSTSGTCAARLNPHADVNHGMPFERFLLDNPNFTPDAIVGNVPFGTRTVEDLEAFRKVGKGWKDNGDFFVHESLSRLKPGGTMALIVPHGITTGKNHAKLRRELMKQGRVVGAYRLPNTAFSHTGTQTITDILVIQKHPDPVLNAIAQKDKGVIASTRDDAFIHGKYFDENPDNILGTMRATTNQYGGESFTVDGSVEDALAKAPPLAPKVSYDGLNLPTQDEDGPQQGDEKYIGGRLYRFEGHPGRWHLVPPGDGVKAEEGADPSAYGTGSVAEAEAMLKDPGQRVMIDPENLRAFAQLAGATLDRDEAAAVKDASMAVDQMGSTVDKAKLAHAMLLAGHLQRLQKMGTDDPIHLEQALAMLQAYRETHGNPATDRSLSALAKQLPTLLHLQGAFDEEGTISDYFANHDAVMEQAKRSHSEAGAAMGEAFRAAGGEGVTLGEIRQHLDGTMTDDDLAAALAADPTVGYMGGGYMPLERLLVGNGFNLIDAMLMEADTLPDGSPLRRKLEEQVGMVRARLQPRAMEDITTPFWAVGSWIPADALNAFLEASDYRLRVEYNALASEWRAVGEGGWGIGQDILTTMNRGRISHGINTKEAKEAIAALEQQFGQWLSGSDYRLQVEEAYNIAFNGDLPQEFSGEPLDIPLFEQHGGDPENGVRAKRLHDYQNSTIRQMAEQGRGIIALDVGLGKTATSIALALHLKAEGRSKKPTFVVPKSVLANWVKEVGFWAADANVMVVGQTQQFWKNGEPAWAVKGYKIKMQDGLPARDADGNYILHKKIGTEERIGKTGKKTKVAIYDTEPTLMDEAEYQKRGRLVFSDDSAEEKNRKLRLLANNAYDIVLMTEPVFQGIKLDTATETQYIQDLADDGKIDGDSKKTHEKMDRIASREAALAARSGDKNETVTFEELGVDCLIHDEAHHLKNLLKVGGRNSGTAFLSTAEADRALDFYNKSRYIREQNNNQNTFLLTATPITNNPVEAYNMLMHVAPEEFERRGIQSLDDFLGMFGAVETVTVPNVKGELVEKQGLIGFQNLLDLSKLSRKYTRKQNVDQVNEIRQARGEALMHVPDAVPQAHDVTMTPTQKAVYESLRARVDELASQSDDDENKDHLFSIISDMDKVAISLDYYNEARSKHSEPVSIPPGEKSPKLLACANEVMSAHNTGGKQLVFCDSVAMHEQIKAELAAAGYPEDQIAIVNATTAPDSDDRQYISDKYNDGHITLVIGNTATMGEGMNFQVETTDIHHLTFPWTPAHIQQRNGRGVRQGNVLDSVNVHTYQATGSFDGYRVATLDRKTDFIEPFWAGQVDRVENMDRGTISAAEARIMMADNPEEARRLAEADTAAMQAQHSAKMTGQALKQFANLQTMKLAHSKMAPDQRNSERGRALEGRVRATAEALGRNQHFPHKDLLDGNAPAYVGTDGTVLRVGDHVQKPSGAVYRIESIDPGSGKMTTTNVSGRDGAPTLLEKDPTDFKFTSINNRKAYDGVKPISFDTAAHAERVIEGLSTYGEVARMDAQSINANRDRILEKLRGQGYSGRVPYLDPSTNLVEEGKVDEMPAGAQVLWPHDGDALEHVLRTMTDPRKERDSWRYQSIAATVAGGSSWLGVAAELKPRIEAYREQHKAMAEQGPKEGDTRINSAGNQEVFRSGRWHRVGEDEPTLVSASMTFDDAEAYLRQQFPALRITQHQSKGSVMGNQPGRRGVIVFDDKKGGPALAFFRTSPSADSDVISFHVNKLIHELKDQGYEPTPVSNPAPETTGAKWDGSGGKGAGWSALADELGGSRADAVEKAILETRKDSWVGDLFKERELRRAITQAMSKYGAITPEMVDNVFSIAKQHYASGNNAPEPTTVSAPESAGASPSPAAKGLKSRNLIGPLPGEGEDLTPDSGDSDWAASNKRQTQSLRDSAIKNREMVDRLMADPDVAKVLNRHLKAGEISVNSNGDVGMSATRRDSLERAIRKAEPGLMRGFERTLADMISLKGLHDQEQPAPSAAPSASSVDPTQAIVDGMMALYRADDDGATERNDTGFNGFHTPYKYDGGVKQVKNEFVANMIERIEAGQTLTPNQLAACAKILTVYGKQLEKQHKIILPTTEELKAVTDAMSTESKPERAAPTVSREGWTRQDWAKEIVAALKEDAMAHGFQPNVWDKKGAMRIYLNTDGPRTGPGYIDVHPDGTISNESTLPDNHPALTIAAGAANGFKPQERVSLSGDKPPGREPFARLLEQELNNFAAGDVKASVWTGGRHVRVYLNDPTKGRKSGGLGFIDVGSTGISTGGGLKSSSPLYQLAKEIADAAIGQHGRLEKAAKLYTLAGVAYELRRVADRVFLKKVSHAI